MKRLILIIIVLCSVNNIRAADYWQKITVPTTKNLLSVSFGSKNIGFIAGVDSTLLKTTDGGKTWIKINPKGMAFLKSTPDITDLFFVNDLVGFALVGQVDNPYYKGVLYKTTDGGNNWVLANADIAAQAIFFFDENNGFQVGSKFFSGKNVIKLSSGVWQSPKHFSFDPAELLHTVDFYNTNVGITGGDNGFVYRTFDGGNNWDTVKTVSANINDLKYLDEHTIMLVTDNYNASALISNDKGETWTFNPGTATFDYPIFKSIAVSPRDSFILIGKYHTTGKGTIFYFKDHMMKVFEVEEPLTHVSMSDNSTAFIVGNNGLVLSNIFETAGINEASAFILNTNVFPNPSSGVVNITSMSEHELVVYDALGRRILEDKVLAKERLVDLTKHSKGLYFIELKTGKGECSWTKLIVK
ncbi:MAG: YCF48-related protein [Bacteroidota bacterium]